MISIHKIYGARSFIINIRDMRIFDHMTADAMK